MVEVLVKAGAAIDTQDVSGLLSSVSANSTWFSAHLVYQPKGLIQQPCFVRHWHH